MTAWSQKQLGTLVERGLPGQVLAWPSAAGQTCRVAAGLTLHYGRWRGGKQEAHSNVRLKINPPVAAVQWVDGDCGMKREP